MNDLEAFLAVCSLTHDEDVFLTQEQVAQRRADGRLVVDDDDAQRGQLRGPTRGALQHQRLPIGPVARGRRYTISRPRCDSCSGVDTSSSDSEWPRNR